MRTYLIIGSSGSEYAVQTSGGLKETIQGLQEINEDNDNIGEWIKPSQLLIRHFLGKVGYLIPAGYYEIVDGITGERRNYVDVTEIVLLDRYGREEFIKVASLGIKLFCTWALLRDADWD